MSRDSDVGEADEKTLGQRIRPFVRRSIERVPPAGRLLHRLYDEPRQLAQDRQLELSRALKRVRRLEVRLGEEAKVLEAFPALVQMYESLRGTYAERRVAGAPVPAASDVEAVEREAVRAAPYSEFFSTLSLEGEVTPALVAMTRALIESSEPSRARCIAQVLQQYDPLRPAAEVCLGILAFAEPMPETAWNLLSRNELPLVLRWAADEYFQLAFRLDPATAESSLSKALKGEVAMEVDPYIWIRVAYHAFAANALELALWTLERAEAAVSDVRDPQRMTRLGKRISALREWLDRATRADEIVDLPEGEIPFALVGYSHPEWEANSTDLDDPTETLATLSRLISFDDVTFDGDAGLVAAADRLRADRAAARHVSGPKRTVRLFEVERDLSRYAAVPDGTWIVVSDWFRNPLAGWRYDVPLNPRLRPIFLSFEITPLSLAAPGAIDYLRRYAPIGCRDWDSVFLLLAARVPAFFSGALITTVGGAVGDGSARHQGGVKPDSRPIFVDVAPDRPGRRASRSTPAMRDRDLAGNLSLAADALRELRAGDPVVASSVRAYLAARALGAQAEFKPDDRGDFRVTDYLDLPDDDFTLMQRGIADKLGAVLGALIAGEPEHRVYEAWRAACADDVARAEGELHSITWNPDPTFDLDQACQVIRSASVIAERSQPAESDGSEVNVEFSVDENYKHQLEIVLASVVEHTDRAIRAFVLCRGYEPADFERMAQLFPTVSFVWMPTDNVEYGQIPDKIRWATIVTMDRTILPVLLPEVERIIHFDLDALCLDDLGELFDVDMEGTAIAAVDAPQPIYVGGLDTFRRSARRLRREGKPDIARELIIRTHAQHPFDFEIFNAGVMVLDLAKMRTDDVCNRFLGYIQRFGLNGQVIMNLYVGRDRKKVSADWNRLVRLEVAEKPKIAHWAGPFKPWRGNQYAPGREWWQEQEDRFAARVAARSASTSSI